MKSLVIKICAVLLCALALSVCACNETNPQANCDNGHNLVQVGYTAPTCQTIGAKVYTCSRCGYTETETLFPIDHDYQVKSTTPSTCTEKGLRLLECSMCHTPKTEEIPCCDHNYGHKTIAPTCFTDGEDFDECDMCGTRINLVTTPKYTHKFSSKNSDDYSRCELCGVGSALFKVTKIQGYVHSEPSGKKYYCYALAMDIDRPEIESPVSIPDEIPNHQNSSSEHRYYISSHWVDRDNNITSRLGLLPLVCENGLPKMWHGERLSFFYNIDGWNYKIDSYDNKNVGITFNVPYSSGMSYQIAPYLTDYPTSLHIEFTPDMCSWIEV